MNHPQDLRTPRLAAAVACAVGVWLGSAPPAGAQTAPAERCRTLRIEARGIFVSGASCPSPVGLCVEGTFRGGLRGTVFLSAEAANPVPSDPLGRQAVVGSLDFTTRDGVFTVDTVTVFDAERGTAAGSGRVVDGSGRFAGASGDHIVFGQVLPDGSIKTTQRTTLCLPR